MLEQLKASRGKKVVLELVSGRIISGTVLEVDDKYLRLGTDEGVGTIHVSSVQVIWEGLKRSLSEENMDQLAKKLRDSVEAQYVCTGVQGFICPQNYVCRAPHFCRDFLCPGSFADPSGGGLPCVTEFYGYVGSPVAGQTGDDGLKAQINCTAFPGFTCAQSYICRPPDNCSFSFACPGSYVPGFPAGGGGCPLFACGPFQFQQPPCGPLTFQCGPFQFQQPPCGPLTFQCGPFQFQQPPCGPLTFQCGPFQFQQPPCGPLTFQCGPFQFQQPPCGPLTFQCGPFQFQQPPCSPFVFGGSQCVTPGGFVCPGQQFIGAVGPPVGPMGQAGGLEQMPGQMSAKEESKKDQGTKE